MIEMTIALLAGIFQEKQMRSVALRKYPCKGNHSYKDKTKFILNIYLFLYI